MRVVIGLTQNVLGSQLPEVLELEVDVDDGDAPRDGQDDDVTAQHLLEGKKNNNNTQRSVGEAVNQELSLIDQ